MRASTSNPPTLIELVGVLLSTWKVARAEDFFRCMGIKIVTGSHYPGGLFGDRESEDRWLVEKIKGWTESVKNLLGVALKHLHSA